MSDVSYLCLGNLNLLLICTYTNLFPFSLCWQESQAAWGCAGKEGLSHFYLFLILLRVEFYVRFEQKLVLERFTTVYKKSGPFSSLSKAVTVSLREENHKSGFNAFHCTHCKLQRRKSQYISMAMGRREQPTQPK